MNLASFVDTTMLNKILATSMSAVDVATSPFRFFGPNGADKLAIHDVVTAITRDFTFLDELDCVGAFYATANTIC